MTKQHEERLAQKSELTYVLTDLNKTIKTLVEKSTQQQLANNPDFRKLMKYRNMLTTQLGKYDLHTFVSNCWQITQKMDYQEQWYIREICRHLELLYDLEFLKLIISISPRSGKSTILSTIYPVWLWLQEASNKIISVSYDVSLATRDMSMSRDLMNSSWFGERYGDLFKFAFDQNQKDNYKNDKGGSRLAVSPGSKVTGYGAHYLCMDDINRAQEAGNTKALHKVIKFYEGTLSTRWVTPDTFRRVCLQQRLSVDDLSGYLQREDSGWVVLSLPEEYTGRKHIGYGGVDPRNSVGELLKPTLLDRRYADEMKEKKSFVWESQFQQNPVPPGGRYVKDTTLRYWSITSDKMRPPLDEFEYIFISADLSDGSLAEEASYNCFLVCGVIGRKLYVLDVEYEKLTFPDQLRAIEKLHQRYPQWDFNLIEEHSSGRNLCDYLLREKKEMYSDEDFVRIHVKDYGGDKLSRFMSTLPWFEKNFVYLPDKLAHSRSEIFVAQLLSFPNTMDKDFVDALTQALNYVDRHREDMRSRKLQGAAKSIDYGDKEFVRMLAEGDNSVLGVVSLFNTQDGYALYDNNW